MEMDETVLFSMDDHWQKIGDTMWQFYTDGQMVDININCHGHSIWAHKVVLAMFSPILRASLTSSTTVDEDSGDSEGPIKSLNLDEVAEEGSDVEYLLEFMYRGHVSVPKDRVDSVLCTAEMLEIRDMMEAMRTTDTGYTITARRQSQLPLVKPKKTEELSSQVIDISSNSHFKTEPNSQYDEEDEEVDIEGSLDTDCGQETNGNSFMEEEEENVIMRQGRRRRRSTRLHIDHEVDDDVRKKFKCTYCAKIFWSERGYDTHIQGHADHAERRHKCPACDFSTVTRWSLLKHMAVMHRIDGDGNKLSETIVCEHCDFTCVAENQLAQHVLRKHSAAATSNCSSASSSEELDGNDPDKQFKSQKAVIRCATCGFQCQTHTALAKHAQSHLGAKAYKCPICGVEYADRGKFKAHVLRHTDDEKKFVCRICNHACHRKDNLRRHLQAVHGEIMDYEKIVGRDATNYVCQVCNYGCSLKENMLLHLRKIHNKSLPLINERKPVASGIRSRVRDEKSFNCHVCKKTIRRKDNFRVHLRTLHGISLEELLGSDHQSKSSRLGVSAQQSRGDGGRSVGQQVSKGRSRLAPAITIIPITTA